MKVVLLHAFPLDERMWESQLAALAEYDVAAPRLYGLGETLDEWADGVLDQVDGDVVAVGASMGGYVALRMAARAPERVRGLFLAGSRTGADSPERRRERDVIIGTLRARGVAGWLAVRGVPSHPLAYEQSADDLIRALAALRDRPDSTDVVRSFRGPLVVAVGDGDELLSVDEAREIAELASDGRLQVFEGAGHLISLEQPDRFNELLAEFLAMRFSA